MNDGLNSQKSDSRYIVICLIMVTISGLLSALFINYQLYQSRHIAEQISNSVEYSLSTLTPMLNEQQDVIERIEKARHEANLSYVYVRKILKELGRKKTDGSNDNLIKQAELSADKIKLVRVLIDESRRSTDEVGGNFNYMLDQLENLGRVKEVSSSLNVLFTITVITMSLLTFVLLLGTLFIHHSLKRIKAASEQTLRARAELQQSQVQQTISDLNCLLSGERSVDDISKRFLEFLAPKLGAGVATFYYFDNGTLCFKQGYAYSCGAVKEYKLGEGIVGQVAVQKTTLELDLAPKGYLNIASGIGSIDATSLVVVPVFKDQDEEIKGVVEFGLLTSLTGFQYALLQESIGILTIAIRSAQYRDNLNHLLNKSEQQKHQLEVNSRKLVQARDDAQQATRAKSEFLAAMSHEIRTPMNGVLGMLQVLQDTGMSKEQSKYLQVISGSAESLLRIINDILDFSKIEVGKVEIENVPFDLLLLIEDVFEQLNSNARKNGVSLLLYFDPRVPRLVRGDPVRIRQILINVLGNGIKFTHEGYVQLNIEALKMKAGKENIAFRVKDTGVGIAKDKLAMVFNQFTQSDSSISRQFGGTGLGLSISKSLTESMGGEITVSSTVGQGSLFTFNLLLDRQEENIAFPIQRSYRLKVLLVDSNEPRSRMLQIQIASWGMEYCHVSNIEQMLGRIKEGADQQCRFDCLIIDEDLVELTELDYFSADNRPLSLKDASLIMLQSVHKKTLIDSGDSDFSSVFSNPIKLSDLMSVLAETCDGLESQNTVVSSVVEPATADSLTADSLTAESLRVDPLPLGLGALKVLLVDDNKINQKVASVMLEQMGICADIAENGEDAIAMLMLSPYDLVLMDCQMPVMDGYTAARTIRQNQQSYSNIYIIALTANAMDGDKDKCLEAGMNDYLSKPLRKGDLAAKLQQVLIKKEGWQAKAEVSESPNM